MEDSTSTPEKKPEPGLLESFGMVRLFVLMAFVFFEINSCITASKLNTEKEMYFNMMHDCRDSLQDARYRLEHR